MSWDRFVFWSLLSQVSSYTWVFVTNAKIFVLCSLNFCEALWKTNRTFFREVRCQIGRGLGRRHQSLGWSFPSRHAVQVPIFIAEPVDTYVMKNSYGSSNPRWLFTSPSHRVHFCDYSPVDLYSSLHPRFLDGTWYYLAYCTRRWNYSSPVHGPAVGHRNCLITKKTNVVPSC